MYYPKLNQRSTRRVTTDTFLGYNHQMKIRDGEWYDTKNLTAMRYPMFSPRPKRALLNDGFTKLQAIIAKDSLYWVENGTLYANGYATGLTGLQTEYETRRQESDRIFRTHRLRTASRMIQPFMQPGNKLLC